MLEGLGSFSTRNQIYSRRKPGRWNELGKLAEPFKFYSNVQIVNLPEPKDLKWDEL